MVGYLSSIAVLRIRISWGKKPREKDNILSVMQLPLILLWIRTQQRKSIYFVTFFLIIRIRIEFFHQEVFVDNILHHNGHLFFFFRIIRAKISGFKSGSRLFSDNLQGVLFLEQPVAYFK